MANVQSLIQKLQSNNTDKRYDACEELRVMVLHEPLPQEAIEALRTASNDSDPDVADAAQRALALHTQSSLEAPSIVLAKKTTATEYAVRGFFIGTVVSSLLIFLFFTIFGSCTEVCPYAMLILSPILGVFIAIISGIVGVRKTHKD